MQVNMYLELKDVPGSLVKAIEPISSHGGNIISVLHSRGEKGTVIVHIVFKVQDYSSLDIIKKNLELRRIRVKEINIEGKPYFMKKIYTKYETFRTYGTLICNEFGFVSMNKVDSIFRGSPSTCAYKLD